MKILYFSQVSWRWIKQRPHFIAEELAELGHDVTFKAIAPVGKRKIIGFSKNLSIREMTGVRGSAKYELSRIINGILAKIDLAGKDFDIIILTYPFQLDFLPKKLRRSVLVYDCMDMVSEFYSGRIHDEMAEKEKRLCEEADAIIVSSNRIKENIVEKYLIPEDKVTLVRNAFDRNCLFGETNHCADLPAVKCPSVGYMGTIDKWIDFEVIFEFCRAHKEFTMYFIGPVGAGAAAKMSGAPENVILTGPLEHGAALELMKGIDAALIPFKVTELIRGVDPVKMYEYLALKKPVVSSYWSELDHFVDKGHIFFYNDQETFESGVLTARECACGCSEEFLRENNWGIRAEQLETVLKATKEIRKKEI